MAVLDVLQMGHPTLKQVAKPVTQFDATLEKLADDMFDTMVLEDGIGLAAPQVGESIRLIVIDLPLADEELFDEAEAFVNPEIIEKEGSFCIEEGCLSVPELREEVDRFRKIKVRYQDLEGETHEMIAEDILAVVFQHEIDHLDGILFVDRLPPMKRQLIKNATDNSTVKSYL